MNFDGTYYPVRTEREIQHKTKKFTEFAQKRIERIVERNKLNGVIISISYAGDEKKKKKKN